MIDSVAYTLAVVDTVSDVEGKILVDFLADTIAEVEDENLGNTATDAETEEVVEMHDNKLASGGKEN